jgi:hypothetical protein
LPLSCEPGTTCFIQSYVDVDPGSGSRDFRCGSATYDGHKGVDFRLLSVAAARTGVSVLAAADGTVRGARDGMQDAFVDAANQQSIADRECGNGVVIDHGQGWETQYCHMRKGSVAVRTGQHVARGTRLGEVGYSGLTQFPHVHISVRHNGAVVDPFSGAGQDNSCRATAPTSSDTLWEDAVLSAFSYVNGEVIGAGFTADRVSTAMLEADHQPQPPDAASPALVFFARFINLVSGDKVRMRVSGPAGYAIAYETPPLDRNKASYVATAGRRRTTERWPSGAYEGAVDLIRGERVIASRAGVRLDLP